MSLRTCEDSTDEVTTFERVSGLPSPLVPQGLQGQLPPPPQGLLGPQHFIGRQLDLVS